MAAVTQVRIEQVAREDLVMFVNACFSCTGQREFYGDARGQSVSIEFLHQYILGNYRRLYARTLAAGINHFNQAQIVLNLLASGSPVAVEDRREEGALIAATLRALPPPRAFRILESLRARRINNRRARAIAREYLEGRADLAFDAVKYRSKVRAAVVHGHVKLGGELGPFLFHGWKKRSYTQPLLEAFRQAHYTHDAVYALPYTVAEGLAAKHGIPRDVFLQRIEPRLTQAERLRLQESAARDSGRAPPVDLERASLTKLALYTLALTPEALRERRQELHTALERAAARVLGRAPVLLGRVAAVLDNSYSASGSLEKRRRPLGVALAAHYLLSAASRDFRAFWTCLGEDAPLVTARGQTDIATPLLEALAWGAELVVIVSDGYDNDPPGAVAELTRVFRARLDPERRTALVHVNPVFDAEAYAPRSFGTAVPTVGVRDAEDLPTVLGFARFAEGAASLAELEGYLSARVRQWLERDARRRQRAETLSVETPVAEEGEVMGDTRLLQRLEFAGLRLAPSQVWGGIRLVPVLRDSVRGDLRFARRTYDDVVSVVSLGGGLKEPGLKYCSYIPHGLVMTWGSRQSDAVYGTQLQVGDGKRVKVGPFSVRLLHRMVHREDKHQLRMLPLHLAMEGFLALHFGGPDVAWAEYSREALSHGLSPRFEGSVPGWASSALDGALRTFEVHEQQVGVLLFNADVLLSAFVVAHPEDYRVLHRTLLEDFYGELLLQYGFLGEAPELGVSLDAARIGSLDDLRAEVTRMRRDWADFHAFMAGGLFGVEVTSERIYDAGPFLLQRFHTSLVPSEENHLGEAIVHEDGTLEYLKTYRLSAAQTRRAYLLQQLALSGWKLEDAAERLNATQDELVVRLRNAGFGYLLKEHVLEAATRRRARGH